MSAFKDVPDTRKDKHLRCRACRRAIARTDDRICIQGSHEHTCTNPHGIVFHIGCFRAAPGGTEIGEETYEYTWFTGYRWQIMLCAQCKTHLGWSFQAHDGDCFYGLILDRLIAPN